MAKHVFFLISHSQIVIIFSPIYVILVSFFTSYKATENLNVFLEQLFHFPNMAKLLVLCVMHRGGQGEQNIPLRPDDYVTRYVSSSLRWRFTWLLLRCAFWMPVSLKIRTNLLIALKWDASLIIIQCFSFFLIIISEFQYLPLSRNF